MAARRIFSDEAKHVTQNCNLKYCLCMCSVMSKTRSKQPCDLAAGTARICTTDIELWRLTLRWNTQRVLVTECRANNFVQFQWQKCRRSIVRTVRALTGVITAQTSVKTTIRCLQDNKVLDNDHYQHLLSLTANVKDNVKHRLPVGTILYLRSTPFSYEHVTTWYHFYYTLRW